MRCEAERDVRAVASSRHLDASAFITPDPALRLAASRDMGCMATCPSKQILQDMMDLSLAFCTMMASALAHPSCRTTMPAMRRPPMISHSSTPALVMMIMEVRPQGHAPSTVVTSSNTSNMSRPLAPIQPCSEESHGMDVNVTEISRLGIQVS